MATKAYAEKIERFVDAMTDKEPVEVTRMTGVPASTYKRWRAGDRTPPRGKNRERLDRWESGRPMGRSEAAQRKPRGKPAKALSAESGQAEIDVVAAEIPASRAEEWFLREMAQVLRELPTERARQLAIDVRASAVRAITALEAERGRRAAENARREAERAARERARAASFDARRSLLTCRGGPGNDGSDAPATPLPRRTPAGGHQDS